MIIIKFFIIFSIILSVILAFITTILLTTLVTKKENFLFTKIISNKKSENFILKSGTGILSGSSIFLIISLSFFFHNYNCGFRNNCETDESKKIDSYHHNITNNAYGKAVEWINGFLILLLFIGLGLFSYELFNLIEDTGFNKKDELILWIIFGLSLTLILTTSCLLIYLLIIKIPLNQEIRVSDKPLPNKINNKCENIKKYIEKNIKKYSKQPEIDNINLKQFYNIKTIFIKYMETNNNNFLKECQTEPQLIFDIAKYIFTVLNNNNNNYNNYNERLETEINNINNIIEQQNF